MAKCNLIATVEYSWYVKRIYLPQLILFGKICESLGIQTNPDFDLIAKTVLKGMKIKAKIKVK
jgi:hypothetical protein